MGSLDPAGRGGASPRAERSEPAATTADRTAAQNYLLGKGLDINRATPEELTLLEGIGPRTAARIISFREARGDFGSPQELDRVPGIGPALMKKLDGRIICRPSSEP